MRRPALLAAALLLVTAAGGAGAAGPVPEPPWPHAQPVRYGYLDDLAYAADGTLYAIRDRSLASVTASGRLEPSRRLGRFVQTANFGPGARLVAEVVSDDMTSIRVRARAGGPASWQATLPPSRWDVPRAAWSVEGRRLLVETEGRPGVELRDARSGRLVRRATASGSIGRQPLSPDGAAFVLSHRRGAVVVRAETGRRQVLVAPGRMERPSWSPDGRHVAGGTGTELSLVEVATGRVRTIPVSGTVEVAWSPDSRFVAAYGSPGDERWALTVIDAGTGRWVTASRFEQGEERGEIAWSPDGRRVAFQIARPLG